MPGPAAGRWRLIVDGPAEGAWNMAVDRAILLAHAAGDAPPTLRLYRWSVPTVSLGRFQKAEGVDQAVVAAYACGLCRRPTGGRGVLHDDELTYSVVAGVRDGMPRGVGASYRVLCRALAEAYRLLGVPAELTARSHGDRASAACYLHATPADLSLGAAKLSGSAQVWCGESLLQHGSFVISRDVEREARLFGLDDSRREALRVSTTTITEAAGRRPEATEMEGAVVEAFERTLGVSLERGELADSERVSATGLVESYRLV